MLPTLLSLVGVLALGAASQDTTSFSYTQSISTITGSIPSSAFTDSQYVYDSGSSQVTVSSTSGSSGSHRGTTSTSSTNSQITALTELVSLTVINGNTVTANATDVSATATTSSVQATNTVPCNGYPQFCNRKYSNITHVCSHNSAFVVQNNAASNQMLSIQDQLNDGVRMLQGETHYVNDTIYNCHTSCDLLNAGTWQSELEVVADWLQNNPYDVLTILIVNSDFTSVENYVAPITNAGLLPYVYTPSYVPQHRDQWPTLGDMILKNQRLVFFMDYDANQTAVPYILDEFTHMWETPFSPTNQSFPCTLQRPPGLSDQEARENFMYLSNHNLNVAIDVSSLVGSSSGTSILIPNTAELNITNGAANQFGRLEAMARNCTADWDLPPNFLLVDYYNIGSPKAGSVFEVAAAANGVQYTRSCCGDSTSGASAIRMSLGLLCLALTILYFT